MNSSSRSGVSEPVVLSDDQLRRIARQVMSEPEAIGVTEAIKNLQAERRALRKRAVAAEQALHEIRNGIDKLVREVDRKWQADAT